MNRLKKLIKESLDERLTTSFEVTNGMMQRGVGDIVEVKVSNILLGLEDPTIRESYEAKSKRSIEDVGLITNDYDDVKIDIKTHNIKSELSMPNLISISRVKKFYEKDNHLLLYVFVDYVKDGNQVNITNIEVRCIEEIDWDSLTIGNLGKGQLQITKMSDVKFVEDVDRGVWLDKLSEKVIKYYQLLITKIETKWIKEWE
tara:strand:- start:5990 stop:6592 length:603 start_codon:yes stop_codon:yes gene_type:complete